MSLTSALNVGKNALQVSQNALNTTSHNISNANTVGYTRQQVSLSDRNYQHLPNGEIGSGVIYSKTRQVRDPFLDKSYREQNAKSGYYNVKKQAVENLESLLDDSDGLFNTSLKNLWSSIQELVKNPEDSVNKSNLIQRSGDFITSSKAINNELNLYKSELEDTMNQNIEFINKSLKELALLNNKIVKFECGCEQANDLRDSANNLIDEISRYTNIEAKNTKSNGYQISINNTIVVDGRFYQKVNIDNLKNNGGEIEGIYSLLNDKSELSLSRTIKDFNSLVTGIADQINDIFDEYQINEKIFGYVGDNHKISGLSINKNLEEAPTILSFLKDDKTIKTDFLNKLSNIDFFSGYRKIANEISTKGNVINESLKSGETTLFMIEEARKQLLSVSTDEELTNLMTFQNMYNASGRYINTVNDMMNTLLNM